MPQDIAVFGLYPDRATLEDGLERLKASGFRSTDVSIVADDHSTHQLAHEITSKAPEGAATGAATGGAVGGILGWLVGLGMLTVPGLGPLIAAGPIVAALAGIGAGGATGGFIGALVGAGIPEIEAKRYEGRIRSGSILCSVHCDDKEWARRAGEILRESGAHDVASTREPVGEYHR